MGGVSLRVLIVEPGCAPYEKEIAASLAQMQAIVGGTIQAIHPFAEPVALICNDEAKLLGMPLNRALYDGEGRIYDVIAGTFFLCGILPDSSEFTSLEDAQIRRFKGRFRWPELFARMNGNIVVIPVIEAEEQRRETDE